MGENLSKHVTSISLATALHGLKHRLYSPGVTLQVDDCQIDILEGGRFRVTYSNGKTETYKPIPVTEGQTA